MSSADARARRRFWICHALLPLAGGLALLVWFERSGLDLAWSDRFFVAERGGWYLKNSWWADDLLHRGGRAAVIAVALAAAVLAATGSGRRRWAAWRRPALYVVVALAACGASIGGFKAASPRPCPWDVDRYGGPLPLLGLFEARAPGTPAGHCFPAAHAGVGYSLFALYFALRDRSRRAAGWALAAALVVGSAFSFAQIARGAHFASHNLASALWCWIVTLALYEWLLAPSRGAADRGSAAESEATPPAAGSSPISRRYSRSAP